MSKKSTKVKADLFASGGDISAKILRMMVDNVILVSYF